MSLHRSKFFLSLALLVTIAASAAAKDLAVISNKANPVKTLALADLAKISKGATRRWPNGKEVVFVIRDPRLPEMKLVVQRIYGMDPDQVKTLITTVNRGHHERPAVLVTGSDEAVVKAVQSIPGALGVVDVYSINGSINVLKVDGKIPLEPGYVLHAN